MYLTLSTFLFGQGVPTKPNKDLIKLLKYLIHAKNIKRTVVYVVEIVYTYYF